MNMRKKTVIASLLLVVFIGAFLRFYKLGNNSFVADEFLDINSSYAYHKTGVWQNWDFNFGEVNDENAFEARDSRAWVYKWQVAQVFKVLAPTEGAARSVSAIWGIISIILIYFVATYFTKKKEIGLLAAFLFAVSTSGIIFDRRLRMYAMFFPVYLAFSWMLFRFLEEKYDGKIKSIKFFYDKWKINLIFIVPAVILGVLSILVHQLAANIVFVIVFYCVIRLFQRKNKFSLYNKYLLIILLMLVGYIGALIIFPQNLASYAAGLGFTSHWTYFTKVFVDYSNWLMAVFITGYGGWWLYRKSNLPKESLWLSINFLGVLLLAVFAWNRNVGDQYIFFIQSFGIILVASGIYGLAVFFGENLNKYKKSAYIVPVVLILLILPNWGYFFQSDNAYRQTSEGDSANYKKIFAYFKKARQPQDVLITRNFRNYYWSGAKIKVYDFGGELSKEKLSLEEIKKITGENASGWIILSDNDDAYIANDAMEYVTKNTERVSNVNVRGKVHVYRWGNDKI